MTEIARWLTDNGLSFTGAGDTVLIFNAPPAVLGAHGAAITSTLAPGLRVARMLRGFGWAVCSTDRTADALRWVASLGYSRDERTARPALRVPASYRGDVDLAWLAECVLRNPGAGAMELARDLSAKEGRPFDRWAINRALIVIGWGPREREAYRGGLIAAPELVAAPPPPRIIHRDKNERARIRRAGPVLEEAATALVEDASELISDTAGGGTLKEASAPWVPTMAMRLAGKRPEK